MRSMTHFKPTILVTGGAGYIGSQACLVLQDHYRVVVLDNLELGHREVFAHLPDVELIIGNVGDRLLLNRIFAQYDVDAVIHFAASAYVGESIHHPAKYYRNNVVETLTLLQAMVDAEVKKIVFSSTCATYGVPSQIPIPETHVQQPINPYGRTKLVIEGMLHDFQKAYGLEYVCFRYFNAAGADPQGRIGEDHYPEPHLIPRVLLTALGYFESLSIYGTDYPTPDGTCVRDYIHVVDLAQAHRKGLEYLLEGQPSTVFNLGNGQGFSVMQVIETARQVTERPISVELAERRPGDPPALVGSGDKAQKILGWQPMYPDLETIMTHAWNWHLSRHGDKLPTQQLSKVA